MTGNENNKITQQIVEEQVSLDLLKPPQESCSDQRSQTTRVVISKQK